MHRPARLMIFAFCLSAAGHVLADDGWQPGITVAPYGWLVTVGGDVGAVNPAGSPAPGSSLEVTLNDDYDDGGAMLYVDWRGDRWMTFLDTVWIHASQSGDASPPVFATTRIEARIDAVTVQGAVGYRVAEWDRTSLVAFGGLRYYDITLDLDASGGVLADPLSTDGSDDWVDGLVGLRLETSLGERWRASVMTDVGKGGSDAAWQVLGSIAYGFSWGSVVAGYRHLDLDYSNGNFAADIDLSGPMLGVAFSF